MKVIILIEKYGGNCNRLFQSLHYHSYAIDNQYIFLNPSIMGILKFNNYFFNILDKIRNQILKFLSRIISIFCKENDFCINLGKKFSIRIVRGWDFRAYDLTLKHQKRLKDIYRFYDENLDKSSLSLKNFLNQKKQIGKFLVGLHIRRGDYKNWNDGKYFFDDDFYKKIIYKVREQLKKDNEDPFVIAVSDQKIKAGLGFDFVSNGSWIEDQIALQKCDLLIGPPSTFTMWASYLSKIPLIQLKSKIALILKK